MRECHSYHSEGHSAGVTPSPLLWRTAVLCHLKALLSSSGKQRNNIITCFWYLCLQLNFQVLPENISWEHFCKHSLAEKPCALAQRLQQIHLTWLTVNWEEVTARGPAESSNRRRGGKVGTSSDTLSWSQAPGLAHPELNMANILSQKPLKFMPRPPPLTLLPLDLAPGNPIVIMPTQVTHKPYCRVRPTIVTSAGEFLVMFEF